MVTKEAGWNMFGSSSLVIRSVFEGGEGCDSGGMEARSIDIGDCALFADSVEGEEEGEDERGGESVVLDCAG